MEKIRAFISITVPEFPVMGNLKKELRRIPSVTVSNESHLTLQFLGDVDIKKIKDLSEKMNLLIGCDPFIIDLNGVGAFPDDKRPRVVWAGSSPLEMLGSLVNRIRDILDSLSIEYDDRKFKAHITLARIKDNSAEVMSFIERNKNINIGSFECSEICLMKSVLTPKGAVHSVIASIGLSGDKCNNNDTVLENR